MTTTQARGAFKHHILVGADADGLKVFATIKWDGRRISLTAVVGPMLNGDCKGSCGQCVDDVARCTPIEPVTVAMRDRLITLWHLWHLNDMRAGCEHQRAAGWDSTKLSLPCPQCGYQYGHAWLFEAVPDDVVAELRAIPTNDTLPACWR